MTLFEDLKWRGLIKDVAYVNRNNISVLQIIFRYVPQNNAVAHYLFFTGNKKSHCKSECQN